VPSNADTESISIVITRHAEKPGDSGKPRGINTDGEHDPHSLSVRGWTRAGALASLFGLLPNSRYPAVQEPVQVYATHPSHEAQSTREYDTAGPTAKKFGIKLESTFKHGEEKDLANVIIEGNQNALVVWHHGAIPRLLEHFDIENRSDIPESWPEDRFDLLWVLSKQPGATSFRWHEVNQSLLDGDVA
jgi:hypothetical protein